MTTLGRCLTGVDTISKGLSEFVAIDEEANHEIVHALRLGKAQRAADESLDPSPQSHRLALNFLGVLLASLMLHGMEMPLVGSPSIGGKLGDAKRLHQLLNMWDPTLARGVHRQPAAVARASLRNSVTASDSVG